MRSNSPTFAIVASTEGSVMNEVLKNDFFRAKVHSVILDRKCGALEVAKSHNIRVETFAADSVEGFCDRLLGHLLANEIDYVISYYTNFYSEPFRNAYEDRIINFHPSLLPAFKGMDGFGDTIKYHARFAGNTVEFIADVMDEGKIIMQTACPVDTNVSNAENRHKIFVQQCKALLQVVKWLDDGRITVNGRQVVVSDAMFHDTEYSPALDFADSIELEIPGPWKASEPG